jgi:hypothetical protein
MRILMKSAVFLVLFAAGVARSESLYDTFERTEYYCLKLSISRLRLGFVNGDSKGILSRISKDYREGEFFSSQNDYKAAIERILATRRSLNKECSGEVKIFFNIMDLNIIRDSATARFEIVVYSPEDNFQRRAEMCQIRLSRMGGGWQIYDSDGWLRKMGRMISRSRDNTKSRSADVAKSREEY